MRLRLAAVPRALALAVAAATLAPGAAVAPAVTPVASVVEADPAATARLRAAADARRAAAGRESFFYRSSYGSAATKVATALVLSQPVALPTDNAPTAYAAGYASPAFYETQVDAAIQQVVASASQVIPYPLHTDGGWSVVTRTGSDGLVHFGVALVVGWPAPPISADSGCATNGYCWSTRGLHPHLPWTRNRVTWYLSTANLPAAGESLVKTAIARLNAVSGFGADLAYGGRTTDTVPTSAHRFLVVWGGSGCASTALACTTDGTQGTYHLIYQARTIVMSARYNANPSTTWWVGTLMHEIAHATGLGHFDGAYLGTYQLMRWANGPNAIQTGDANGLRRLAPPGALSASLRGRPTGGNRYDLVVRAGNAGLGGLRAIRTECTDASGAWVTVGLSSGTWDARAADRVVGSVTAPRTCRATVRSKAGRLTTAAVTIG
ncbi:MAG TPA: hypothetical protein VFQ85_14175 [Mycobacteriales bacterium]|jgi:hypothetical protein|nr:hypothetical protein [Mycobacteriales bacterium]